MKRRSIEDVFRNERAHWVGNGFRVKQYFPSGRGAGFLERFSPFILLDYNAPYRFPALSEGQEAGVDIHPHRGFETVTFAFKGKVAHGDNAGNYGVIDEGDIQWMTAARGILHKEFHEKEFAKKDRDFHMVQLWVNLPAKEKMRDPGYQAILKKDMGIHPLKDDLGQIIVYAGEVLGTKGPASTFSPMDIYKVEMKKPGLLELPVKPSFNAGFLVLSGSLKVNEETEVAAGDFVLFRNDGEGLLLEALTEDTELLVLTGEPLGEPVVAEGPFVMNTREEIWQANLDYMSGKFGKSKF